MSESKKRFLTRSDLVRSKTEEVEIPALGGFVKVRELPAGQVMEFMEVPKEASLSEKRRATMRLIASAVVDENDKPMFSGENDETIDQMPIGAFNQLGEAVMRVVGIAGDKADEATAAAGTTTTTGPVAVSEGKDSVTTTAIDSPTV